MTTVYHQSHQGPAGPAGEMSLHKGDEVFVNLAAFIGSHAPSKRSVRCRVVDVGPVEIQVCPEPPCRPLGLWIASRWVDGQLK
jgi:hypothetical protein